MEENKKVLLLQQANKLDKVLNVLLMQFGEEFEDEVNYLKIVKVNLEKASTK